MDLTSAFDVQVQRCIKLYGVKGLQQERITERSVKDTEFIRRASMVRQHLGQVERILEEARRSRSDEERTRLRGEDETSSSSSSLLLQESDFLSMDGVVDEARVALQELRRSLSHLVCCSSHHWDHYEAIVQMLDARASRTAHGVWQEKTRRLASLASRMSSQHQKRSVTLPSQDRDLLKKGEKIYDNDEEEEEKEERNYFSNFSDFLSAQERQALVSENAEIQARLADEVTLAAEQIQRQLHELSQVMHKFSVEMVQQKQEMSRIVDVVIRANVNVDLGNQNLIEATSTAADFRFFVLMFIVIMTVSLLFLRWYS